MHRVCHRAKYIVQGINTRAFGRHVPCIENRQTEVSSLHHIMVFQITRHQYIRQGGCFSYERPARSWHNCDRADDG